MPTTLDYEFAPPRSAFDCVVDLASGAVVGWDVRAREQTAPTRPREAVQLVGCALAARDAISAGEFLAVRASTSGIAALRERLIGAGPLDRLAIILIGDIGPDALALLKWTRQRGALVGCDGAIAILDVEELRPDMLALRAAGGNQELQRLSGMAQHIGARALAHRVSSLKRATALRDLGVALAQGPAFGAPQRNATNRPQAVAELASRRTVHELAEGAPSVMTIEPLSEVVRLCVADDGCEWVMFVDEESRPVRLLERTALLRGEPFEHRAFTVHGSMSVREMARTASRRPARDRLRPLALCDPQGRYEGLLRVERLLDALAA
jgi:hypothetical protein